MRKLFILLLLLPLLQNVPWTPTLSKPPLLPLELALKSKDVETSIVVKEPVLLILQRVPAKQTKLLRLRLTRRQNNRPRHVANVESGNRKWRQLRRKLLRDLKRRQRLRKHHLKFLRLQLMFLSWKL